MRFSIAIVIAIAALCAVPSCEGAQCRECKSGCKGATVTLFKERGEGAGWRDASGQYTVTTDVQEETFELTSTAPGHKLQYFYLNFAGLGRKVYYLYSGDVCGGNWNPANTITNAAVAA